MIGSRSEPPVAETDPPSRSTRLVWLIAGGWFLAVVMAILWSWGGTDPRYFESPDEAVNRLAAERVAATGLPEIPISSADPEDLRHPRLWLTIDDHAIPSYPPTAYYIQGALLKSPLPGGLGVALLSAAGVAAFAAAVALLRDHHRWVAALAPAMAFPALFWMVRPWMNMATFLSFLCIALFFFALWRRNRALLSLACAAISLAMAAAVRPDYAPFVLGIAACAGFAEARAVERRWMIVALVFAGVVAVGINLALNAMTTGHAFTAAYEIADARQPDSLRHGLPGPLSKLMFVVLPYGVPETDVAVDHLSRYWLWMGPTILFVVAAVGMVPLAREHAAKARAYAVLAAIVVLFLLTHITTGIFGADADTAQLRHSVARYWSPVYMLAALPPALLAMRARADAVTGAALGLSIVLASLGAYEVFDGQPESLAWRHDFQQRTDRRVEGLRAVIPPDSVVYTLNLDKVLWSEWQVATVPRTEEQDKTVASMMRVLREDRPVYLVQSVWPEEMTLAEDLADAMGRHGLRVRDASEGSGVFEVLEQPAVESQLRSH